MTRQLLALISALCVACAAGPGTDTEGGLPKGYTGGLIVAPNPVSFEDTEAGCTRSVALDLVNSRADSSLVVTGISSPDESLSLSQSVPLKLGAGGRRSAALHFTPDAPGRRSGVMAFRTDEGGIRPYEILVTATATQRPAASAPGAAVEPLDLVFVLDVSTTMNELAKLREAVGQAFESVAARALDVRFGLVSFANDVVVHGEGAFQSRDAFFGELDGQLVPGVFVPDPDRPRQLMNFDFQENSLDALMRAASGFAFRDEARRYLLLMTDDTFLQPPAVFSDGTPAVHSYAEVARTLVEREIRLFSVHAPLHGAGLSSAFDGAPSLVEATRGAWFEVADVDRGSLSLGALLSDLIAGRICNQQP